MSDPVKVYFVLGEASGDALAADLLPELQHQARARGQTVQPMGLAGEQLSALGVKSLFEISDIAVMGVSAVVTRLPTILSRIRRTVNDIVSRRPDVIVLIDSPEFCKAVAKRVRKRLPDVRIIKYVCPSVWAWRPGRASKMRAYVDHVLCLLPFEPRVLEELGGPAGTYVGHPLAGSARAESRALPVEGPPTLLLLPGSRRSEVERLLPVMGGVVDWLQTHGHAVDVVLPAVPHLRSRIEAATASWNIRPRLVSSAENASTFAQAHAACAASGTVSLQLAVNRVPMILAYKLDPLANRLRFLVTAWSAALPNLIAGWMLVPENFNEYASAERLARTLLPLLSDTPERRAQLAGFDTVIERLQREETSAETAARIILESVE